MRPDFDDELLDPAARSHMRSIRREIEDAARERKVVERFREGVEMLVLAGCGDRIADLAEDFVVRYGVGREILMEGGCFPRAAGDGEAA